MPSLSTFKLPCAALLLLCGLAACASNPDPLRPVSNDDARDAQNRERRGTVFGTDGLNVFGTRRGEDAPATGAIGVNAYLWRASLDTLDFLPLASADPFGGLIISDWYQPAQNPGERLKVQVSIGDARLRADALRVAVFRQVRQEGAWLDAPADPATSRELEDRILTRARELRIAQAGG